MGLLSNYNYFADQDYSDYRELICYERPVSVLLHYEYNITYLRLWLFDRFDFEWKNNEFIMKTNEFESLLKSKKIISEHSKDSNGEDVEVLINDILNSSTAILVNYFSKIGESVIVSTLMLEKDGSGLIATSLRGDSFYVRKSILFSDLKDKIYFENGKIDFFTINFSEGMLETNPPSILELAQKNHILSSFQNKLEDYSMRLQKGDLVGSKALRKSFDTSSRDFSYWNDKVNEGFSNALLVNLFWPIQFAYKPFLVFLGYLERNNLLNSFLNITKVEEEVLKLILNQIRQKSEIISSLGILFGKKPSPSRFSSFINLFEEILNNYEKIEVRIISSAQTKSVIIK